MSPSPRSEEHTSELQSRRDLVCRLLLEKKKTPAARTPASVPNRSRRHKSPTPLATQPSRCVPAHPRPQPPVSPPQSSHPLFFFLRVTPPFVTLFLYTTFFR